jgi:hypothetical protein
MERAVLAAGPSYAPSLSYSKEDPTGLGLPVDRRRSESPRCSAFPQQLQRIGRTSIGVPLRCRSTWTTFPVSPQPIVCIRASLDADKTWIEPVKKSNHLRTVQLSADHHRSAGIILMNLKHVLRDIQANRDMLTDGWSPLGGLVTVTLWLLDAGSRGQQVSSGQENTRHIAQDDRITITLRPRLSWFATGNHQRHPAYLEFAVSNKARRTS